MIFHLLLNPHAAADGYELIRFDSPEDAAVFAAEHGLSVEGAVETNWPVQTFIAADAWAAMYAP